MNTYVLTLRAEDLEAAVHGLVATTDAGTRLLTQLEESLAVDRAPRPTLTREAVDYALVEHGGNVSAAARALGYSRSAVREKAGRYRPQKARP